MYSFEYGRYVLYRQEQELIDSYIEHQYELDEDLEQKFAIFCDEMKRKQDEFESLIENAFEDDVMERFKTSILIARKVGIDESEILTSVKDIDDYFE